MAIDAGFLGGLGILRLPVGGCRKRYEASEQNDRRYDNFELAHAVSVLRCVQLHRHALSCRIPTFSEWSVGIGQGAIAPPSRKLSQLTQRVPCYTGTTGSNMSKLTPGWQRTSVLES